MNITVDGGNPSDNLICPRCSTSIPPHAIFCGSCGMPINKKKKNEEEEVRTENDDDDAQEQEADETVRLPSLSQAHLKGLQSYRSLKNDGRTEQTYKSSSLSQYVEAPAFIGMKLISDETPESPLVSNNNSAVTRSTSDARGCRRYLGLPSAIGVSDKRPEQFDGPLYFCLGDDRARRGGACACAGTLPVLRIPQRFGTAGRDRHAALCR